MERKESQFKESREWVGKFVHYNETGKHGVGKVLIHDSDGDRYIIQPTEGQNFFIKGDVLRRLRVEEK